LHIGLASFSLLAPRIISLIFKEQSSLSGMSGIAGFIAFRQFLPGGFVSLCLHYKKVADERLTRIRFILSRRIDNFYRTPRMNKLICFAHRGAMGYEPENTLLAVEKAIQLGTDWIEVDVFVVEEELVVIHDDRLERTTNGSGYVMEKSLAYLRSLDAGKGQQIPFLREVFEVVGEKAGINVELKGPGAAQAASRLIEEYIRDYGRYPDQFLVSSYNHPELYKFHQLQPTIRIGALTMAIPLHYAKFAEELNAYSVHAGIEFINSDFVQDAHRRRMKMFIYTVNHQEALARMRQIGVDGIFTDYPGRDE